MTTTTIPNINRGADREIICKHCRWKAAPWRAGEPGPPPEECHHCKDATPEQRAERRRLVDAEGAKFGARVKANRADFDAAAAELDKALA